MKKLLLATALLLGLSGSAWAQKSKSALTTEVNTNLASNSNISASILRTTLLDVINSFYDLGGASTLSCGANNWIAGFPTLSSINCIQPSFSSLLGTLTAAQFPALTGDVTTTAGALATTLATVNANVGTFGSATSCITVTNNAKGLTTAISAATCTPAIGSVTGLGTGVATALGVNVGTAGAFVTNGGALGTPTSGVASNLTGTASGLTAGNVTTNANLTGPITSVGNATSVGAQTGTGSTFVMNTSPTLVTPTLGVATATSINGANIDNLAWTPYTPTVTAQGGTPTTVSATGRYKQIGKTVFVQLTVSITTVGTATGYVQATLPFTSAAFPYEGSSVEYLATGKIGSAFVPTSSNFVQARDYAVGSYWVNGYGVLCNVVYEVP